MKRILRRFESNRNKSKQMKINDVFDRYISKAAQVEGKLNEANSSKILNRIKTNQNKLKSVTFFIVLLLKPKTLLY